MNAIGLPALPAVKWSCRLAVAKEDILKPKDRVARLT
jgi:hypothetical protein